MIKEKLARVQALYEAWLENEAFLRLPQVDGKRASIRRTQVFLKEKIQAAFKDIRNEMQPKLFVVYLMNQNGSPFTIIMRAESKEDITLYVRLLEEVGHEKYDISRIEPLPTIYQGNQTFTIR